MKKSSFTKVYGGRLKDRKELRQSSSGGAFTALSNYFLNNGNAIVASVYNYDKKEVDFQIITNFEMRDQARGSKYIQSKPGHIFIDASNWLDMNPGKSIMFIGTGCQAEGFRKYADLKGIRKRVFIVDIICHGIPSPKLWREYATQLEQQNGKIRYITFKDKRNGWLKPTAVAKFNDREISLTNYVNVFYNRCALRPSCYCCHFAKMVRNTDITIGDFWHIENTIPDFYDSMGTSLFLIHTELGMQTFEKVKCELDYRESDMNHCWQANLENPTAKSEFRDEFWNAYKKHGAYYVIKQYGSMNIKIKILHKFKQIIYKFMGGV